MTKRNYGKRVAAGILAAIVAMTSSVPGFGGGMTVEAASSWQSENLLVNPDFEDAKAFGQATTSHLGNWFAWQSASKTTASAQSGTTAAIINGNQSSLEQDVTGLNVGSTYVYSVWAKVSTAGATSEHVVGVKNYGGAEVKQQVTSTEWTKIEIEFVYTSGNPRVYGWVDQHQGADLYLDNASITVKSDVQRVDIANGEITVAMADSFAGTVSADDFSANYYVGTDSEAAAALALSNGAWNAENKTLTMSFDEIAKLPGTEQVVTVNLSYGEEAPIQLDFTVEAGEGEAVVANLAAVEAENGSVKVVLDKVPTVDPKSADFTWEYKLGNGEFKALAVEGFAYDSENKAVTVSFSEVRASEAQTVTVKVTFNGASMEDTFAAAISDANTYYVDSTNGNDANDGLTPETAFASIDKLNDLTFLPGDEILFKKGETFVGCFKPQGSGTEAAPITIGSYGDDDARPVLQPGEDWQVSHIMSADAMHPGVGGTTTSPYVNYVIQFYNVEYWEVSDLEIYDPTPQTTNDFTATYCSGITIQGEEIGTLEHFYIDNVIIHGFHGPGTNLGKTSGGITMNVITNKEWDRSRAVPTQINDIRITNCEIYDVGRSGINFLTPWAYRTEGKWANRSYGTGRSSYGWLPYEDFYLGNNYIHDIDGDGCIVDNCANAVVENNLVTQCVTRLHSSAKMAVGLFNWNSDDTYFQFNEVYDIQIGGSAAYNDGQGIEIDALNDRTWVQYNYVHDNRGGFMMFCTIGDYIRGYDYVVRYNISQNDYAHPRQGVFDVYADTHNGQIYNNTLYLTERALKNDQIFLFATAQSSGANALKMYNNIFYYDGETPKAANQFGDANLDWQSNIFYGFTNLPVDDNPDAPNLSVDPMLVAPGEGGTGSWNNGVITKVDLSCYELLENSPAINAGVPVADNGGRDYFGNEVAGIPDIGAYESGSVALKAASINEDVTVSQANKSISMLDSLEMTVEELLEVIVVDNGITVEFTRNGKKLAADKVVAANDVMTISDGTDKVSYTVTLVQDPDKRVIPVEYLKATAGDEHATSGPEGPAYNVLDDNMSSIWHTDWYGTSRANHWIQLEVTEDYVVDAMRYYPRTSGTNGTITKYEIQVSNDGSEWTTVATGDWAADSSMKVAAFEPQRTKYVRLVAVNAGGPAGNYVFASAAELRLLGDKYVEPEAPQIPADEVCKIFVDVEHDAWYEESVQYVYDNEIIVGDEKVFAPNDVTTRAMVAVILYRLAGSPEVSEADYVEYNKFTDLPAEHVWYSDAVAWALNKGVSTGDDYNMLYNPTASVTREQLALFLWRYAKYNGEDVTVNATEEELFGGTYVDDWAKEGFAWAVANGIIKGAEATDAAGNICFELNPQGGATRAQLARVFHRFCEK